MKRPHAKDGKDEKGFCRLLSLGPSHPLREAHSFRAFTLIELLVAMAVFALLLALVVQLFNSANAVSTLQIKRLDADAQARMLLDRMVVDFAQMLKRRDVDYFLKSPGNTQAGNDQIAFYSEVPGYYPSATSQSPMSLVGYRVNTIGGSDGFNNIERLGKGLLWNGVGSPEKPMVYLPLTLAATWPAAANAAADPDYEQMGSNIFRFEYYYLVKDGTLTDTPWNSGSTGVRGLQDVTAIGVVIAVMDPKTRTLVTDAQLEALVRNMGDFDPVNMTTGSLENQWRSVIAASGLPKLVLASIRVYGRTFYLNPPPA